MSIWDFFKRGEGRLYPQTGDTVLETVSTGYNTWEEPREIVALNKKKNKVVFSNGDTHPLSDIKAWNGHRWELWYMHTAEKKRLKEAIGAIS